MAKKRLFTLFALVIVLAAVAAVTIMLLGGQDKQQRENLIVVAEINTNDVDSITVTREGSTVSLIKQDGVWCYADNIEASVDQLLTESALTYLSYVYADEIVLDSVDDKTPYGLDPAQMTIALHLKSGEEFTYLFGVPASNQQAVFMQLQGDARLYLFGMDKHKQIVTGLENVKDLSLNIDAKNLSSFSLVWAGQRYQMDFEQIPKRQRTGTEEWRMTAPFNAIANPAAVQLVEALFNPARLAGYISDDMKPDYGINDNSAMLTLKDISGKTITLTLGNQTPQGSFYCVASDRTGIYSAFQGIEALLKMDIMDAVAPGVFPVSEQLLPPFTLTFGDMEFVLMDKNGRFVLNGRELTQEDVGVMVKAMLNVTLDGSAPKENTLPTDAKFEMGNLSLKFSVYKKDFFVVSLDDTPFGYFKIEKFAELIDLLDKLVG